MIDWFVILAADENSDVSEMIEKVYGSVKDCQMDILQVQFTKQIQVIVILWFFLQILWFKLMFMMTHDVLSYQALPKHVLISFS